MRWLLRRWLSDDDRQAIEAELHELYHVRRREVGDRAAGRWIRRERRLAIWHLIRERFQPMHPGAAMPHLVRDIRYSLRSLLRAPTLALTIVATVGVGLGATTAMSTIVRSVLVNPLPYEGADRLMWIYTDNPPFKFRFSVVDYRALERDHPAFSAVAAYQSSQATLTSGDLVERVAVKSVTGSYFPLLGQRAELGRLFDAADDATRDQIAVLNYDFWSTRFGKDPSIVGRAITLDGVSVHVVGVLQPTPGPLEHTGDVFVTERWPEPKRKGPFLTMTIGRLRGDMSEAAATDALHATNKRLFPIWQSSYQNDKATWGLQPLRDRVVGDIATTLLFVLAAVACVLLIACANAVNLLIGRALQRSRELAIRTALGASRARVLQHVLVESAVLTVLAGAAGFGIAAGALKLVATYGDAYIPRIDEIGVSAATIGTLALLAGAAGVVIGLIPALHSTRARTDTALRSGTRSATDGPAARRVRNVLVALEFALAMPLLAAAGIVLISLDQLGRVPVGIDTDRLLTASISLAGPRYADASQRAEFWRRAVDRLSVMPGVESAAIADSRPPNEAGNRNNFDLEDHPSPNQPTCIWVGASPTFFKTAGVRLDRGRLLDAHSLQADEVVVDRVWANRFFPGQDVIGRRFKSGGCTDCAWTTVIGQVSDARWGGLDTEQDGTVYYPFVDVPDAFAVIRAAGDPSALVTFMRAAFRELDPGLPLTSVETGRDLMNGELATPKYLSVLTTVFAVTALLLSIVGIYGVMTHFVQQHTRDIGIRVALGGEPGQVRRMIVMRGLKLVVAGVAVGIAAAVGAGRYLSSLAFGVSATDPRMIGLVAFALVLIAAAACLIPARRASRVDPAAILREG
ncbi:MAG: ABC transporter permease [Acidobacteria bacterium]|nr:MAG: ABC transporter permease [Acidobacteriota bacterium]